MGPKGVAAVSLEIGLGGKAGLHPLGQVLAVAGGGGQRRPGERALRDAGHPDRARHEDNVFGAGFKQMRSQVARLLTHLVSGLVHCRAAVLHRARAHRARAALDRVGVGMDYEHRLERQAELLGRNLGQRGLMALSERGGAAADGCSPVRLDAHRTPLRADPHCSHLDVDRKPDPELHAVIPLAAPRLLGA